MQVLTEALTDTIASSGILRNQLDQRDKMYQQTQMISQQKLKGLQTQIQIEKVKNALAEQELKFQSSRPVQHVMHRTVDNASDLENVHRVERKKPNVQQLSGFHKDVAYDYQFGEKHDHTYKMATPQAILVL